MQHVSDSSILGSLEGRKQADEHSSDIFTLFSAVFWSLSAPEKTIRLFGGLTFQLSSPAGL